jgi:large subunit ribosomal protein L5
MQAPRTDKVVLNIGLGEALTNSGAIDAAVGDLATITGQRPVVTRARKSIANFKLRDGNRIGVMATLRGDRMWDFLDRLLNAALPCVRDFHGVSRESFDGRGNYTLGLTEQVVFPEIDYNRVDKLRGLQVTVVTTSRTDEEARRLLELLGMPFARAAEFAATA